MTRLNSRAVAAATPALAVAIALAIASSADAADIARPVYKAPVAVAPAFSWTGFYVGGNAGYGWADFDRTGTTKIDPAGFGPEVAAILDRFNTRSLKDEGWLGGLQAGYNWQAGIWVLGVEGDLNWTGLKRSIINQQIPPEVLVAPGNFVDTAAALERFATLRGRVGVAFDRLFVYGTGGAAWAEVNNTAVYRYLGGTQSGFVSKTVSGWTAGGGFEYALTNNWTFKAEYLYLDLDDVTVDTGNVRFAGTVFPNTNTVINQENRLQLVRAGINYKFDWGKSPVVAKY